MTQTVRKTRMVLMATFAVAMISLGIVSAPQPAEAARGQVWANLFYLPGCNTGGYNSFVTSKGKDIGAWNIEGLRYSVYAGDNRFAHGAWINHVGSVLVQPWARVELHDAQGYVTPFSNPTDVAQCFPVNSVKYYTGLVIRGL